MTAIVIMAAISWAQSAEYVIELSNPSEFWLEVTIHPLKGSLSEQVVVLGPGADTTITLDHSRVKAKVKNKKLQFKSGELVGFNQKVKWPAVKVKIMVRYFEDSELTLYRGHKHLSAKTKKGKQWLTYNEQRQPTTIKEKGSQVAKVSLPKKPPTKEALTTREVVVINHTPATISVVLKEQPKYLQIRSQAEQIVRIRVGATHLLVYGQVTLKEGNLAQPTVAIELPKEGDSLIVEEQMFRQNLVRVGVVINNSDSWVVMAGDFSGKLAPHSRKTFQLLAGERARVNFSYFRNEACRPADLVRRTSDIFVWPAKEQYWYWSEKVYFHLDVRDKEVYTRI